MTIAVGMGRKATKTNKQTFQGVGLTNAIMMLEMFPKEIRGYMEVMGLTFWTTGIALITPVGYLFRNISWRYMQVALACCSAWSLVHWW